MPQRRQQTRPTPGMFSVEDARAMARRRLPRMIFDYVDGAAGDEAGERLNRALIGNLFLLPRGLVNIDNGSLAHQVFGQPTGLPFGIAPMGLCNLTWPGADRMLARLAEARDMPHALSTVASSSIEEMASPRTWFQLYASGPEERAMGLVERAAAAGYQVLMLTVDVPQLGRRRRELRNGFKDPIDWDLPKIIDFAAHPRWSLATMRAGIPRTKNLDYTADGSSYDRRSGRGWIDFAFLDRLRARWPGKLVVKGVLCPDDARRIQAAGADGVYVSSHGGRQLDSGVPPIVMLPRIREAVGAGFTLLFDSGLRSGEDILKALALGADFCLLGRPMLYAIGADGERGLATLIDILADELGIAMAQIGKRRIAEIDPSVLADGGGALSPAASERTMR